jgi:hypothetical protein
MEIAIVVLVSINILASVLSPIILATSFFIQNIQESKCCFGGDVIMRNTPIGNTQLPQINLPTVSTIASLAK